MNISQWKNGDRTFFSLEVDDRLLLLSSVVVLAHDLSYMYIVHVQDDDWSPVSRTSAPCLSNYTLVAHLDSAADMAAVAAITASNVTVPGWVRSRCDAPLHRYRLSR